MTKQDFLMQLQRELNGRIGSKEAADHIEYYREYIEIGLRKGHTLEEVMEELGNPGLIARSIAEVYERIEKKESANICAKVFMYLRKWFDGLK